MTYWQFDVLVLVLPVLLLLRGHPLPTPLLRGAAALAGVALVWTGPWDEHLVRTGVWAYGEGRVLALVGSVPVEEYAFVVLEVLLVAAWGARTGRLPGRSRPAPAPAGPVPAWAPWVASTALGALLVAMGGDVRYLGLLLLWAGPPLAVQRAVAGDLLRSRRTDRLVVAVPVVLWLCLADRLALGAGIWGISPDASTGSVLGLPVEEALFFGLTGLLVTDGLLLATEPVALARARALLGRLHRPAATAAPTVGRPRTPAA